MKSLGQLLWGISGIIVFVMVLVNAGVLNINALNFQGERPPLTITVIDPTAAAETLAVPTIDWNRRCDSNGGVWMGGNANARIYMTRAEAYEYFAETSDGQGNFMTATEIEAAIARLEFDECERLAGK